MTKIVLTFAFALMLSACATSAENWTTGSSGTSSMNGRLDEVWTIPHDLKRCGGDFIGVPKFNITETMSRGDYPDDQGRNYVHYFSRGLSQTMANSNVDVFKEHVLAVAKNKSFTTNDDSKSWKSVKYVQSNLVRMLAFYIEYMTATNQLTDEERKILISWGDMFIPTQLNYDLGGSADSRAAAGVALLAWGDLNDEKSFLLKGEELILEGLNYVTKSTGKLKRHFAHARIPLATLSLEDEFNLTLGHVIEGAVMLEGLGKPIFKQKFDGVSLHESVSWWVNKIGISGSRPPSFKGLRRDSHNWHVGWIPIYLSKFPAEPHSQTLREIQYGVTAAMTKNFDAISLGGSTDCLW